MPNEQQAKLQRNADGATVSSFGDEWARYNQSDLTSNERYAIFSRYFAVFPLNELHPEAQGFDMGCGSGRWAQLIAPRVGRLTCIDASAQALSVARQNLREHDNVAFIHASVDDTHLAHGTQDFGYSLGVLHHVPDTGAALAQCSALLKSGAPFLVYLYYRFDNRPTWYRAIWGCTELLRVSISRFSDRHKAMVTDLIAAAVYWPLARISLVASKLNINTAAIPLQFYKDKSFYTMRTDSRDRFGTPLERRYTKGEIRQMMLDAGLVDVRFSEAEPYWCAVGRKA